MIAVCADDSNCYRGALHALANCLINGRYPCCRKARLSLAKGRLRGINGRRRQRKRMAAVGGEPSFTEPCPNGEVARGSADSRRFASSHLGPQGFDPKAAVPVCVLGDRYCFPDGARGRVVLCYVFAVVTA